ncbi:DUF5305 domain-containing protein [Salinibaculum rarum]|uniref:DUF5305 domain-containing protein n=1 Tax=Salinibaculum rarum TaxID=3058903 RepID=UPI00265DD3FC|nr:DUF5305 domain-containing protein [Salinibaculum sp. KK48]
MRDTVWWVRLRSLLDDSFVAVLVVALVIALAGGYLTMGAYGETDTRTEIHQTTTWESSASFVHSATVVNDTAVYTEGERLHNRSTYFLELTPRLDGAFVYTYTARDGANLTSSATTRLVYRSVAESDNGAATEYWRLDSPLANRTTTLSSGERLRVPFSVNITAAEQRLEEVDAQFGGTPGTKEVYLETELTLSGTRNGDPVDRTRTYRLPITPDGSVYQVGSDGPFADSGNRTERVTEPVPSGPMESYGGPLLLVLGLVAATCCVGGRYTGVLSVSETEREWLAYRDARNEFDDWISSVHVPETELPDSTVDVESLEDLVDIAIDTDGRVLEATDHDRFLLFGEHRTYAYTPPSPDTLPSGPGAGDGDVLDDTDPSTATSEPTLTDETTPATTDEETRDEPEERSTDESE